MGNDDEFRNFDPRKHWAVENNEIIPRYGIGIKEAKAIDQMIRFLKEDRSMRDLRAHLCIQQSTILRYFAYLKSLKGVSLIRTEAKDIFYYRIQDSRK